MHIFTSNAHQGNKRWNQAILPIPELVEGSFSEENQEVLLELGWANKQETETTGDKYRYWGEEIRKVFCLNLGLSKMAVVSLTSLELVVIETVKVTVPYHNLTHGIGTWGP